MTTPRSLTWFFFLILGSTTHAATPPELTLLRQQYEKTYAERVTAVHETAITGLDAKFTAALNNAINTAKSAGDLPTVLVLQGDQKLLTEKKPLPAVDAENTPESLKSLRAIYREQLAKLNEQRSANATALLSPYTARLQELEATLTKNDRVEEATVVMDYRLGLSAEMPQVQQVPVMAGAGSSAATPAPASAVATTSTNPAKGDDRKAAEWVLSVGGTVRLWDKGTGTIVNSLADLPEGEFSIRSLNLNGQRTTIKPFTDEEFGVLAGLERLDNIELVGLDITPAALEVLSTCPNLTQIGSQYNRFGDEMWAHLAGVPNLEKLYQSYDELPVQGIGTSNLNPKTLRTLSISNSPVMDEALPEIGKLINLTELILERTKVTDTGIASLAGLKGLTSLQLRNTDVTAKGLASLKGLPVTSISYGRTVSEMAAQAPEVAAIFPKVESLWVPRDVNPTTEEWTALAATWPKLKELIGINSKTFTDDACAGITAFEGLEELQFFSAPLVTDKGISSLAPFKKLSALRFITSDFSLTDASLVTLAGMRGLKTLKLPRCKGITPAGIAQFKKDRPDVMLE
jgi:hypothetical protein